LGIENQLEAQTKGKPGEYMAKEMVTKEQVWQSIHPVYSTYPRSVCKVNISRWETQTSLSTVTFSSSS